MATEFRVTFDSADPGAHAAFWAEAVHYVQPLPPSGFDSWDAAFDAWGVPADHRNDRAALVDPTAPGRGCSFRKVPEPKTAKADDINGVCIVMQDPTATSSASTKLGSVSKF
jgi:hypothetical protein